MAIVLYTHRIFLFQSWLLELDIHMKHSEKFFIQFTAMNCFKNSRTDTKNLLDSKISNSSKKFMKSLQVDTELLIHTLKFYLKMALMVKPSTGKYY